MAVLTIGRAADLVDVSIQSIWLKPSTLGLEFYNQYFNVETGINDYYVKDSSLSGLGYAGRIAENATFTEANVVQGYDQTFTEVEYGKILPVTKMMWAFGIKKRNLENLVQELKRACSDLRELRCAERLVNSFGKSEFKIRSNQSGKTQRWATLTKEKIKNLCVQRLNEWTLIMRDAKVRTPSII